MDKKTFVKCFRRVNPAASLKQAGCEVTYPAHGHMFPPGKSGGLIEAAACVPAWWRPSRVSAG